MSGTGGHWAEYAAPGLRPQRQRPGIARDVRDLACHRLPLKHKALARMRRKCLLQRWHFLRQIYTFNRFSATQCTYSMLKLPSVVNNGGIVCLHIYTDCYYASVALVEIFIAILCFMNENATDECCFIAEC